MFNKVRTLLILMFCFFMTLSALAVSRTLTGTVTDTMCGKNHMMPAKTNAECVRECMMQKGNWSYGLVVGDKVYSLTGDAKKFDGLAGQQVTVRGDVTGSRIAVQTITAAK